MNPSDDTTAAPTLSVVPDDADATEEPETQPKTYTFEEILLDNGRTVRKLIDTHDLDDQAAVMLFATTLQVHLSQQQMRQLREDA